MCLVRSEPRASRFAIRAIWKYFVAAALAATFSCATGWASGPVTLQPWPETGKGNDPQYLADTAVTTVERWIEKGDLEKALALLRQSMQAAQAGGADTTAIRFMAAQALLKMRHHAEAAVILGRLAEERPKIVRFRLDYARALFALRHDEEADTVFRNLRREYDLPLVVRRNVERFLERIRARQRLKTDLDLIFWHDSNVNNAPERASVEVPVLGGRTITLSEQPVRAWVARVGARLRWREVINESGDTYIETRASAARNTALGASEHNRTWARLSTGLLVGYTAKIAGQPRYGHVRVDIGGERRWRGGRPYAVSLWTGLGIEQAIAWNWRVGSFTRFWSTRHDEGGETLNSYGRSLRLHTARRIGQGWLTVRGALSREEPKLRNLRWTSHQVGFQYAANFSQNWDTAIWASLIKTDFDGEHPFFLKQREDLTYSIGLRISNRAVSWEGYMPEVTLNWTRTTSTIPLYDRTLRSVQLGLRRLF